MEFLSLFQADRSLLTEVWMCSINFAKDHPGSQEESSDLNCKMWYTVFWYHFSVDQFSVMKKRQRKITRLSELRPDFFFFFSCFQMNEYESQHRAAATQHTVHCHSRTTQKLSNKVDTFCRCFLVVISSKVIDLLANFHHSNYNAMRSTRCFLLFWSWL